MKSTVQRRLTGEKKKKNLTVKERLEYRCSNKGCEQHHNTAKTPEQKEIFKIKDNTFGLKCGCCGSGLEYNISLEVNRDKRKDDWVQRSGVDREFKEKPKKIEKRDKLQKILPKIPFIDFTKINEKAFCHKIEKDNIKDFSKMENNENVELNCLNTENIKNVRTDNLVHAENVPLKNDELLTCDFFQKNTVFDNMDNIEMSFSENIFDDDKKNETISFEKEVTNFLENIQNDDPFFDFLKEEEEK
jgi:hypothetical protein